MNRLKDVFRDIQGLHARIDLFLQRSSILRIGLVPQQSRERARPLLDALVDDPVQSTRWGEALANRTLAKDVLVVQSPAFEFVETQNSLITYAVPFSGAALELLEVNSTHDSWDHLKRCHLHLMLTDRPNQSVESTGYPSLIVIDANNESSKGNDVVDTAFNKDRILFDGECVNVRSRLALEANAILQSSPKLISRFLELRKASRIDALKDLFDEGKVYQSLKASIVKTCREQLQKTQANLDTEWARSTAPAKQWRQSWARGAHEELEGYLLPRLRKTLNSDLAFYKLYARSDDVEPVLLRVIEQGLPKSQAGLQYLMGKIGAHGTEQGTTDFMYSKVFPEVVRLQNTALQSVLTALLGIQIPLASLAVAGYFLAGFDWISMGSLGLLGLTAGFKKLQNDWVSSTGHFERKVRDHAIESIQQSEQLLYGAGENAAEILKAQVRDMSEALDHVDHEPRKAEPS